MKHRGFSLIEAIVSVAILALGIVGSLGALSAMLNSEARFHEAEKLHRLATMKLDEVIATDEILQAPLDGSLESLGEPEFNYVVETEPATVENMLTIRTTVFAARSGEESGVTITTMIYQQPETTDGEGAPQ